MIEIKKKIKELQEIMFSIDMVDTWTNEDMEYRRECHKELQKLFEELENFN